MFIRRRKKKTVRSIVTHSNEQQRYIYHGQHLSKIVITEQLNIVEKFHTHAHADRRRKNWLQCTATTTNVNQLAKHCENDGAINVWAFNKVIEYNLCAFYALQNPLSKQKEGKNTVESVWLIKKNNENQRHRQGCPQKVWNAFPQKQHACGEVSFQGVPLLVGSGIREGKTNKEKKGGCIPWSRKCSC